MRLRLVLFSLSNETRVALLIRATSTETCTDESRPCAALEEEDGEYDTEGEAEGGADEEGGEAAVPLEGCLLAGVRGLRWVRHCGLGVRFARHF